MSKSFYEQLCKSGASPIFFADTREYLEKKKFSVNSRAEYTEEAIFYQTNFNSKVHIIYSSTDRDVKIIIEHPTEGKEILFISEDDVSEELISSINWILEVWHDRFYQESLHNSARVPSKMFYDDSHFMLPCCCGATGSHVYTHLTLGFSESDGSNHIAKKYVMCNKCGLKSKIIDIKEDSFNAWKHAIMITAAVQLGVQNKEEVK